MHVSPAVRSSWCRQVVVVCTLLLVLVSRNCNAFLSKVGPAAGPTMTKWTQSSTSNQDGIRLWPSTYGHVRCMNQDRSVVKFMSTSAINQSPASGSIRTYQYDGWDLTYRYKPASPGFESKAPLLLVHPVGIGLSSWFWERFFEEWQGSELYAPDLIGCGVKNGGDAWDPDRRGLSFPLGWVQGCESLLHATIVQKNKGRGCVVVCQGGLAPVGVLLAARNPQTVTKLVLTSPPTWKDMTTPVPEKELATNYGFLRSPVVGPLAFGVLETRWAIEFFSNLFLFQEKCDQRWLDLACDEIAPESRPPVAAFNAGFCNHRSFREELKSLTQPTLILSGEGDAERTTKRKDYQTNMRECTMKSLPGKNVLPWESPEAFCVAIKSFCSE